MPIVKIIAKGFERYNGVIEGIEFVNGHSTEPLSQAAAERVGAFMKIVDADTDEPLGLGYRMAKARHQSITPKEALPKIERTPTGKEKKSVKKEKRVHYEFTREQLETVADKEGITGLRKVAEQYDVRGRSIAEIVDALMALQANQAAKDAAETPRAPAESSQSEG